jgi:hypothetical protein
VLALTKRNMTDTFPYVSKVLVSSLKEAFPDQLPSNLLTLTDKEIGSLFGIQIVIQFLEARLLDQEDNVRT